MKKLLYILLLVAAIIGCQTKRDKQDSPLEQLDSTAIEQHVFHTFYGDIDVDTMEAGHDEDGLLFYIVHVQKADSVIAAAMNLESMYIVDCYKPANDTYFTQTFGSDGGQSPRIYYNPYEEDTLKIKKFKGL